MKLYKAILICMLSLSITSCIKIIDLYEGGNKEENNSNNNINIDNSPIYIYPFGEEIRDATAEIIIQLKEDVQNENIAIEIPHLKYNKSLLCMLTQDDCKQSAFCRTWAAINGYPISSSTLYPTTPTPHDFYYDFRHLENNDLPPTIINRSKSLGNTDGAGNEVRFSFTTTLAPEVRWMNANSVVSPGFTSNFYRFYQKSGLIWDNVMHMMNYGVGIALHDVEAKNVNDPRELALHFSIAQDSIKKRLSNRGAKFMAEPNGNKSYITAALQHNDIQTITAQAGAIKIYPFQLEDDLNKTSIIRTFNDSPAYFKKVISEQMKLCHQNREAVYIGVHNTDNSWTEFLTWVNNNYGKDGNDSIWMPSHEEFYEYNYYRIHSTYSITRMKEKQFKISIKLPSLPHFYYPSITLNLNGIKHQNIASISTCNTIKGLSYGAIIDGVMINIDCRKHLVEHATHFVEKYEKSKSNKSLKEDAIYFTNQLKECNEKNELLKRLE